MAWNQGNNGAGCEVQGARKIAQGTKHKAQGTILKGLIAGAVIVLGAVGAFVYLTSGGEQPTPSSAKATEGKKIAEGKVVEQHLEVPEEKVPEKPKHFWEVDAAHTNGFSAAQMRKWQAMHMPPAGYTNDTSRTEPQPAYAIFKTKGENEIAAYLTLRPGDGLVGSVHYGEKYKKQILESLDTPVEFDKNDTPEQRALKEEMAEVKKNLKERVQAGEDIGEILTSTRNELKELARYKGELKKMFNDLKKDPSTTLRDIDDYVKAANEMLEKKGIAPLDLGPITRRKLKALSEEK